MDSGISVSGDTISSPDSDISLQHQSVSQFAQNMAIGMKFFLLCASYIGSRIATIKTWTCAGGATGNGTNLCQRNGIDIKSK